MAKETKQNGRKPKNSTYKPQGSRQPKEVKDSKKLEDQVTTNGYCKTNDGKNDISWYNSDPLIYLQSSSISTYHTAGTNFPKYSLIDLQTSSAETVHDVAGAGVLCYEICTGAAGADKSGDAVNRSFINLYNKVRGMYTNSVPFQPNDIAMYTIALGSVLMLAGHIQKILGWINLYSKDNINIPYRLFDSVGMNFQHEKNVYANTLFAFNLAINRLKALTKPTNMKYFEKMYWSCRHTYLADDGMSRGTVFLTKPHGIWLWNSAVGTEEDESILASGLEYFAATQWQGTDLASLITVLDYAISKLVDDDNVRNISGWLRQYVPSANIEIVAEYLMRTEENPVYNHDIISMFKNGKFCQPYSVGSKIIQNVTNQCIVDNNREIQVSGNFNAIMTYPNSWVLTFSKDNPNNDDIVEATRFLNFYEYSRPDSTQYARPISDVITFGNATYYTAEDTIVLPQSVKFDLNSQSDMATAMQNFYNYLRLSKRCEAIPSLLVARIDGGGYVKDYDQMQDIDFSFTITKTDLKKIHDACLLSLFSIPEIKTK